MGHKKTKGKFGVKSHPNQPQLVTTKKKERKLSSGAKISLAILSILIIGGLVYWQSSSQTKQTSQTGYPQTVAGVSFANPIVTSDGNKVSVPYSFVNSNKLVFLDLKLQNRTEEFRYLGRLIPLRAYRNGEYLPLVVISTPSGKTISGIRVCEPCGSFSFHIVQGKYLDCDACHTKWDIETLQGVSGGCPDYPPPRLTVSSVASNLEIDLTPLGIKLV